MKRFCCSFLQLLVIATASTSWAGARITLDEYVEQVRGANPTLKASQLQSLAQQERVAPASTWDDPFFAVGPDEIGSGNTLLRFQLSQSIPFPGKLGAKKRAAQSRAEASRSDAETSERTLKAVATQTFLRLSYVKKLMTLNSQTRSLLESAVSSTQARYKTGDATHHDWLLAKAELSILEVERLKLGRDEKTIVAFFNELRNQPPTTDVSIDDSSVSKLDDKLPQSEDELQTLIANQPELKANELSVTALDAEVTLAKLGYAPDFVVQGMAMTSLHDSGMTNWGFMVGLNLPVFFFRKQMNQVSAAQFERDSALEQRRALENRLKTELTDAWQQLKTARDIVGLYERDVLPTTEIAIKNSRSGYAARRLSLSQLIETLRVQRTQALEHAAAKIDLVLASVRIRELLSNPPILRLAPSRPTLFGSGGMGASSGMGGMSEGTSGSVRMGSGMSGTTQKKTQSTDSSVSDSSGMGGM